MGLNDMHTELSTHESEGVTPIGNHIVISLLLVIQYSLLCIILGRTWFPQTYYARAACF